MRKGHWLRSRRCPDRSPNDEDKTGQPLSVLEFRAVTKSGHRVQVNSEGGPGFRAYIADPKRLVCAVS
jgi:hypothetical protein